jgi:hypothetical protein
MDQAIAISSPVRLVVTSTPQAMTYHERSGCPLQIELHPSTLRDKPQQAQEIRIRFVNCSDETIDVFNPFLSGHLSGWSRGAIAVAASDRNGTFIKDLLDGDGGSSYTPTSNDWVLMPLGGMITSRRRIKAGLSTGGFEASPGTYHLQVEAHGRILSPARNVSGLAEWMIGFPGPEICRSNRVELEILPRTGD